MPLPPGAEVRRWSRDLQRWPGGTRCDSLSAGGEAQGRHWIPPPPGRTDLHWKVVSKQEDLGMVWLSKAVLH